MWKYFTLQLKKVFKFVPYVCLAALILFGALLLAISGIINTFADEDANAKVPIAVVGQAEDSYLEMGLTALQSLDSSRFAIEVVEMKEDEAKSALERGNIAAYIVIPDGFVDAALRGEVMTIEYVSTMGATGLVSMFKDEITHVIADVVLACQRGMYGIEGACEEQKVPGYGKYMNALSKAYVKMVLVRSETYQIEELGLQDELGLEGYLFSGICVVFFALSALPFGQMLIRQDLSLSKLLASKSRSLEGQTITEFTAFFIGYATVLLLSFTVVGILLRMLNIDMQWLFANMNILQILRMVPALLLLSSFAYMLYAFSGNLVGGMLLQFFVTVATCFAGGCMYPVTFFPESIQKAAGYLPHGLARECVSGLMTGSSSSLNIGLMLGYSLLFVGISVIVRKLRVTGSRG